MGAWQNFGNNGISLNKNFYESYVNVNLNRNL